MKGFLKSCHVQSCIMYFPILDIYSNIPKYLTGDRVLHFCATAFTSRIPLIKYVLVVQRFQFFSGNRTISLARNQTLPKKVVTGKLFVRPKRLPRIESYTKFNCLAVYCQAKI